MDTTIRKLNLDESHTILLSDTVGFIRKLPHNLIASFKSTLKEVLEADLILIVLDMASPQVNEHIQTIEEVLKELRAFDIPRIHILNKVDLITNGTLIEKLQRQIPDAVTVSAQRHIRLSELKSRIRSKMDERYKTINLEFPYNEPKRIAQAQVGVEVLSREYEEESVILKIRGSQIRINQILSSRE